MSTPLEIIIRQLITHNGSLSVAAYWSLCLSHPEYGYYMNRNPLGEEGDFTTAPEISQLFGEMVSVWIAEKWHEMGSPKRIYLTELGPGRGTLMLDILRIAKIVPDFSTSIHLHLVETSPRFRAKQAEILKDYHVTWHDDLSTLPDDAPVIFVANEFLDALPVEQYVFQDGKWFERMIGLDVYKNFTWGLRSSRFDFDSPSYKDRAVLEISPARESVVLDLAVRLHKQGGAALLIDYGHDKSGYGDTLQAVRKHQYANVLKDCGDVDITSHVDFGKLKEILEQDGLSVHLSSQANFLKRMGIEMRAAQLSLKSQEIQSGFHRLVDPDQMGELFRVMEIK